MLKLLRIIDKIFSKFCELCAVFFGTIMIFAAFYQVVMRFIFNNPPSWSEAVCRYSMVWFSFSAAGWGVKKFSHVRVDILLNALPERGQVILQKFVDVITIVFCALLGYSGLLKVMLQWNQTTPTLPLSYGMIYLAVPVYAVIAIFYACLQLFGLQDKL